MNRARIVHGMGWGMVERAERASMRIRVSSLQVTWSSAGLSIMHTGRQRMLHQRVPLQSGRRDAQGSDHLKMVKWGPPFVMAGLVDQYPGAVAPFLWLPKPSIHMSQSSLCRAGDPMIGGVTAESTVSGGGLWRVSRHQRSRSTKAAQQGRARRPGTVRRARCSPGGWGGELHRRVQGQAHMGRARSATAEPGPGLRRRGRPERVPGSTPGSRPG